MAPDELAAELRAALALDPDELAYLAGLELASAWRPNPAPAAPSWGWIALVGVVASFGAWLVAGSMFGPVIATVEVGVSTVLLNTLVVLTFSLGQALFDLTRNPALWLSQPLLALLALALLIWPRQSIPQLRSTPS